MTRTLSRVAGGKLEALASVYETSGGEIATDTALLLATITSTHKLHFLSSLPTISSSGRLASTRNKRGDKLKVISLLWSTLVLLYSGIVYISREIMRRVYFA